VGHQQALEYYARSATWSQTDAVALGLGEALNDWPKTQSAWLDLLAKRLPLARLSFSRAKSLALAPLLHEFGGHLEAVSSVQAELFGTADVRSEVERVIALQKIVMHR
jgi:hypothetical protein